MEDTNPKFENNLNEPSSAYLASANNKIRFLSSYKEQEDEMVNYWASISPLQRMAHLHEMIIASYGLTKEQLANPVLSDKITIIKYGS